MTNIEAIKNALQGVIPECGIIGADTLTFIPSKNKVVGINMMYFVECPFDFSNQQKPLERNFSVKSDLLKKLKLESFKFTDTELVNKSVTTKTLVKIGDAVADYERLKEANPKGWKKLQPSWIYMFGVEAISKTWDKNDGFSNAIYFKKNEKIVLFGTKSNIVLLKNLSDIEGSILKEAAVVAFEKFKCTEYQVVEPFVQFRNEEGVIVHCFLSPINQEIKVPMNLVEDYDTIKEEFHVFDKLQDIQKEFASFVTKDNKVTLTISSGGLSLSYKGEQVNMTSTTNKKNNITNPIELVLPINSFFFSSYLEQVEKVKIKPIKDTKFVALVSSPKKGTFVVSAAGIKDNAI